VKIAAFALAMNVLLSVILMNPLKHSGLALANSLASSLNFALLFFFLRRKLHRVNTSKILRSFAKTVLASSVMGILGGMLLQGEIWHIDGNTLNKTLYLSGTIVFCIGIYFILSLILKNEEALYIMNFAKQKFK
jgi:putative peptidoglycan lipid II flippase